MAKKLGHIQYISRAVEKSMGYGRALQEKAEPDRPAVWVLNVLCPEDNIGDRII